MSHFIDTTHGRRCVKMIYYYTKSDLNMCAGGIPRENAYQNLIIVNQACESMQNACEHSSLDENINSAYYINHITNVHRKITHYSRKLKLISFFYTKKLKTKKKNIYI